MHSDDLIIIYTPDTYVDLNKISRSGMIIISNIPATSNWEQFNRCEYLSQHGKNNFWRYACERFYAIESIMKMFCIEKALHIEYDNLIYQKPDYNWLNSFCGDKIGITRITDNLLSAGILYVGSRKSLNLLNSELNHAMTFSEEYLFGKFGPSMINEMYLLHVILNLNNDLIRLLPIFPEDNTSNYVYDCASWGQYVGGTHNNPNIPYTSDDHLIGREINKGIYDVKWISYDGFKCPIVVNNINATSKPLFNLHIHSKCLGEWK